MTGVGVGLTSSTPDQLIAGDADLATETAVVTGGNFERGTLLGKITADGSYTISLAAADDGSEEPVAVLAQDSDASSSDLSATIYLAGSFHHRRMAFGAGKTVENSRDLLAARGIYLKP